MKSKIMSRNFPYYKQQKHNTCGAACMRMALEYFGIKKSEKDLAEILGTNWHRGTWHKDLVKCAEKFNLAFVEKKNATLKDLKEFQSQGFILIICYFCLPEQWDHYSVLKKISPGRIYFYDPWFGPNHSYSAQHFRKIWKSHPKFENFKSWLLALKK